MVSIIKNFNIRIKIKVHVRRDLTYTCLFYKVREELPWNYTKALKEYSGGNWIT